ncbi:MAG: AAC(3) family N-acetyltransferase [Phycisphaerae bacterium]|nr:AAC(3) family N-acetyltransferase [Phycisphaerae bacterium]
MDVTRTIIADGLRQLGVRPGEILLLHSSLKSLGRVEGGPQTLIAAIQDVLTPDGTLVMPTLTWDTVHAKQPRFDVRTSPSRVGLVTETFRTMPGVRRSLHPTHSLAAWGRLRDELLDGHETCTSAGPLGSPYHRIVERRGRILFLGCRLSSNTMMHCVEEWAPVPDSLTADTEPLEVVDYDGRIIPSPQHRHAGARSRHYAKMAPLFEAWGCMVSGRVGEADCRLVDSAIMAERTLRLLREWDRDLFTHDRLPPTA